MEKDIQRNINIALLRCVMESHKSLMAHVQFALSNPESNDDAKASANELSDKFAAALDKCLKLIEQADE